MTTKLLKILSVSLALTLMFFNYANAAQSWREVGKTFAFAGAAFALTVVTLPVSGPALIISATVAGTTAAGSKLIYDASAKNKEAEEIYKNAQYSESRAFNSLSSQKYTTNNSLKKLGEQKLSIWSNDISRFVKAFQQFKNIDIEKNIELDNYLMEKISGGNNTLAEINNASINATELLKCGVGSLSAGIITGVAAYSGTSLFAATSAGTLISSLSGVAASNATLAYLGGGAVSAGGLGVAGGTAILGGVVIGPAVLATGYYLDTKADENLENAKRKKNEIDYNISKINTACSTLDKINDVATKYYSFIDEFQGKYVKLIDKLELIAQKYVGKSASNSDKIIDYNSLSIEEKRLLHISFLATQMLNMIISTKLLDDSGDVESEALKVIEKAKCEKIISEI